MKVLHFLDFFEFISHNARCELILNIATSIKYAH